MSTGQWTKVTTNRSGDTRMLGLALSLTREAFKVPGSSHMQTKAETTFLPAQVLLGSGLHSSGPRELEFAQRSQLESGNAFLGAVSFLLRMAMKTDWKETKREGTGVRASTGGDIK